MKHVFPTFQDRFGCGKDAAVVWLQERLRRGRGHAADEEHGPHGDARVEGQLALARHEGDDRETDRPGIVCGPARVQD